MNPKLCNLRVGVVVATTVCGASVACTDANAPTGDRDVTHPAALKAGQEMAAYPEERPFLDLSSSVPSHGGFYFDTLGNVIVLIKDLREAQAAKAILRSRFTRELSRSRLKNPQADVIARPAEYTFLELKRWRDQLNEGVFSVPGVEWLDLDEVQNRVVVGLDFGADPGRTRRLAETLGVPQAALKFEATGPYIPNQLLTDQFRPIEGAIKIQRVEPAGTHTCTLGVTALWNGARAFITASHCSAVQMLADSTLMYQPRAPTVPADSTLVPIGYEAADYSRQCGNKLCADADVSVYVFTLDSTQWVLGRVAKTSSGCLPSCPNNTLVVDPNEPHWVITGTHSPFVVNDLVNMIGESSGWDQGFVKKTCVNVSTGSGFIRTCQVFANYGSGEGDSGAPVILNVGLPGDTSVVFGGIHSGTSGSNAVFSPWSGIAQDYPSIAVH